MKALLLAIFSTIAGPACAQPVGSPTPGTAVRSQSIGSASVQDFGAIGDGLTDDTAAFQKALDSGLATIRVPDTGKPYLISAELLVRSHTEIVHARTATLRRKAASLRPGEALFYRNADFDGGNSHISIIGGIFDGNNEAQTRSDIKGYVSGVGLRFKKTSHLLIRDIVLRDPVTFGLQIGDVTELLVENVFMDYQRLHLNMDGVHINGPASRFTIRNIHGNTNDDLVALNCADGPVYQLTAGPISEGLVENLHATNGYRGVRLLPSDYDMTDVTISDVQGAYQYANVLIDDYKLGSKGKVGNLTLANLSGNLSVNTKGEALVQINRNVESLTINGLTRTETLPSSAPSIQIDPGCRVDYLRLTDYLATDKGRTGFTHILIEGGLGRLDASGVRATHSGTTPVGTFLKVTGAVDSAYLSGVSFEGIARGFSVDGGTLGLLQLSGVSDLKGGALIVATGKLGGPMRVTTQSVHRQDPKGDTISLKTATTPALSLSGTDLSADTSLLTPQAGDMVLQAEGSKRRLVWFDGTAWAPVGRN